MADVEKVLKGLEACTGDCPILAPEKEPCPYSNNDRCGMYMLHADARMLVEELRRRETPAAVEMEGGGSTWWHVCGECHGAVDADDHYCKHCGVPLQQDKPNERKTLCRTGML